MSSPTPGGPAGRVNRAGAWVRTHRAQAGGGAAALVAVYALWRKHRAGTAGKTGAAAPGTDAAGNAYTAGLAAPNTQASDIQNWVQDALNAQNANINRQLAAPGPPPPPTNPSPHFIYGPAADGLHYIRDIARKSVWQVQPNGSLYLLHPTEYAALGNPKVTDVGQAAKPKPALPTPKPKPKPVLVPRK